jgi:Leucine-rich repeat (LRR) protein
MSPTPAAAAPQGGEPSGSQAIRRDWLDVTVRLATSWVGLFTAYVAALILGLTKFRELTAGLQQAGLPPWSGIALIAAFPILALVFSTIPSVIDQRRIKRRSEIKVDVGARPYFTLRPRDTEEGFERADQAHESVLRWIRNSKAPVLYLTGVSGSGKSSLLTAWVIPKLRSDGHVVITVRGYEQFFDRIKEKVLEPNLIWAQPSVKNADLTNLLERACQRLGDRRLIVTVDQFEEFLILKNDEQQKACQQFLSGIHIDGLTFLLVYRPEYEPLIQDQAWAAMQLDTNRKMIAAFTENAAVEFLRKSGLTVNPDLTQAILHEAAEIEQGTAGLIRPVTINLCGLVLSRFSGGLPSRFRGGIIRGFLRDSLRLPEVRDVAQKIIPNLITDNLTKRPCTIAQMAQAAQLAPFVVRACMLRLGESDCAIVRPLDEQQETWEISHDFLVPLLDALVIRRTASIWRRTRPWMPWAAAVALAVIAFALPLVKPDPRVALSKQGWKISEPEGVLTLERNDDIPPASVSVLRGLPSPYSLAIFGGDVTDVSALRDLKSLTSLYLRDTKVADVSALKGLKSLTSLYLDGTDVTDVSALRDLKSLTSLYLRDTKVADVSALKDLKSLTDLDLSSTKVADVSALKDLKSLTDLDLSSTKVADVSALKDLKSLTDLGLISTKVADVSALKDLKSLTNLRLGGTRVADVSALKDLKSLTILGLSGTRVADVSALKDLKSLTDLGLSRTKVVDVSALKDLKNLTSLDLSATNVADVSPLKDLQSLTSLDLSGTNVKDISVLKDLKSLTSLSLRSTNVKDVSSLKQSGILIYR